MARPAKKKSSAKKAPAKKPVARKAPAKPKAAAKASAKVSASDRSGATPYTPKPIEGVGWPAFRYPL